MKNISKLFFFIIMSVSFGFAQTGTVAGTIMDGDFAEVMAFANVVVKGTTTGTTSDFDGKYSIELEPGTYTIVFSFVGYTTQEISDVVIRPGQETIVDITLATNSLETVVVTTSVKRNTENAVLNYQKKSVTLLDGLSAQSIKKTGAGNIASAVKSVPGVSVQGGKYVYVRGLGDRYTKSILNGVDIPGLDPDRNTIPMDIFPTNIIDNVIVVKSAAAEYPADFTGGIVNVVTKDFPTKAQYSVSVGVDYNPNMHLQNDFLTSDASPTDFLGYDNGQRKRPIHRYQKIPAPSEDRLLLTSLTNRFDKQLRGDENTNAPNFDFGFTAGKQYDLWDNKIGYQASFSYKAKTTFYDDRQDGAWIRSQDDDDNNLQIVRTGIGSESTKEVLLNTLAGITYKTDLSKYKLNFLHIQNGESTVGDFTNLINEAGGNSGAVDATQDAILYTQRSITNLSLSGEHQFNEESDWKLNWTFSPSLSTVYDKDHRVTPLKLEENGDYIIDLATVGTPVRFWRNLTEENWVTKFDFIKKYELLGKAAKLKFGGSYIYKFRDFNTDRYTFASTGGNALIIANGDVNNFLAAENVWNPDTETGAYLDPGNRFEAANSYEGEANIIAAYISNEFNITEKLKTIIGLRLEDFQLYYTGIVDDEPVKRQNTISATDIFPSANFIYTLTEEANLRASYSRTTARPSFKEASSAAIVDPITNRFFIGGLSNNEYDPIKPAYINNFDVRAEWFREGGQMIAVSGFYKDFKDPIETVFFEAAPRQYTVANLGTAQVIGAELEFRQNLGFILESLNNVRLNLNASYIHSSLEMTDAEYQRRLNNARVGETIDDTRDLQGQSPYLINVGLDYANDDLGLRTGLFFNVQGKTLEVVGTGIVPDVYAKPFNSLNFTFNKTFGKDQRSAVDFKVSNILGDKRESVYESFRAQDQIFKLRDPGTEFSLGYSYKF